MRQQDSKTVILKSIRERNARLPDTINGYPEKSPFSGFSPDHIKERFIQNVKNAGANVIELEKNAVEATIASLWKDAPDFSKPEICPEYGASCPLEKMEKIEHVVLQGNFGVAENGAIWLEDKDFPNRLLPFITQHLIIRLDVREIVPDMQDAYRRINLKETGFGLFISGPSKTADIEQSLVYGAHGAVELTVLIIGI